MKGNACKGVPTAVFFEDDWHKQKTPYTIALNIARSFCDTCPVRIACLAREMVYEVGSAADHRSGVYGGMTHQQRHSLEKRGVEYAGIDPVKLRKGYKKMLPIPDRGDGWTQRHTALAETVIAWLIENVERDIEAPSAAKLARTLTVRVIDLRRVYEALLADHIIEYDGNKIVRRGNYASTKYVPPHLRHPTMEAQSA